MLNLDEGSTILNKTKELCHTIIDEPEFQELQNALKAFMADDAAKARYQEFAQKSQEFQQRHNNGEKIKEEEIEVYEGMRAGLFSNPCTNAFIEAQKAVGEVQKIVQDYVTMTFEYGRMPVADDFKSECCQEGGCGCDDTEE